MINTTTTFILGAGSSAPYGFPIGTHLKKLILDLDNQDMHDELLTVFASNYSPTEITRFFSDFAQAPDSSIDFFLAKRAEFIPIGKYLIAKVIAGFEDPGNLNSDWYAFIWNRLAGNCSKEDFNNNKIKFITFNYDRSLEYFLNSSFTPSFGTQGPKESHSFTDKIEVIHLHGRLGALPFEKDPKEHIREYSKDSEGRVIKNIHNSIKIISESEPQTPEFIKARESIDQSERVILLGMGFNEENFIRLDLNEASKIPNKLFMSTFGFTTNEIETIRNKFFSGSRLVTFGHTSHRNLEFLREKTQLT